MTRLQYIVSGTILIFFGIFVLIAYAGEIKTIVWTTPDGKMAITTYDSDKDESRVMAKTIYEFNRRVTGDMTTHFDPAIHFPDRGYKAMKQSELPSWAKRTATAKDRHDNFRDAAEFDGTEITINIGKARVIQEARIERARVKELKKLNESFMDALVDGDVGKQNQIRATRNTLKNLPQGFDLETAQNVSQLRAKWPPGLDEKFQ